MKIFRLDPVPGTRQHPKWEASTLKPVGCWVLAETAGAARRKLLQATFIATAQSVQAQPLLTSPWTDEDLTHCGEDLPGVDVQEGIILTDEGETLSVPD